MTGLVFTALFWKNIIQEKPSKIDPEINYQSSNLIKNKRTFLSQKIELKPTEKKKITIVFAPHPDDEILCCSQKIETLIEAGESVKIIYFTDGDAHDKLNAFVSRNYGKRRKQESRDAVFQLGLENSDLFFLGFPDSQLQDLKTGKIIISDYTKKRKSDAFSSFPFTPYSQKNLEQNLEKLLNKYEIESVYIPSILDEHPDHKFVGEIVSSLLLNNNLFPHVYEYMVHGASFSDVETNSLDEKKLGLIQIFKSQFHTNLHKKFMEQWARIPEKFNEIKHRIVFNRDSKKIQN